MTTIGTGGEFTEFGKKLGISMGRLYRPDIAKAGDWVFCMTDEDQATMEIRTSAPKGRIELLQTVDVTALANIEVFLKTVPSPDWNWRLQISLGGWDAWNEVIYSSDVERDWYKVTIPCAKITGNQPLAVILGPN